MLEFRRGLMETKPLTFQVALRAADGIVIASDTKIVTYDGIRSSSHASKIEVYPEYGLVCAWSGKDVAKTAVNILRERVTATKLRLDTIEIEVEQICREAWEKHFGEEHTPYSRVQARAKLILACRDRLRLWQFDVRPDSTYLSVDDKVIAGDLGNAAVFFLERYYPKTPTPVQRLTFLAAHTTLLSCWARNLTVIRS